MFECHAFTFIQIYWGRLKTATGPEVSWAPPASSQASPHEHSTHSTCHIPLDLNGPRRHVEV